MRNQNQPKRENNEDEKEKVEEELLNFDKPDFVFIPKGGHEWRQRGPYLVCMSCEIQHATWIGTERIMVGIDKGGQPILKRRKELGMV